MRSVCRSAVLLMLLVVAMAAGAQDSIAPRQTVGLVLSGGGAKGIAHIGVIAALEEHNIPIDYVAGTSMGAIVGGLYAMGYTPYEMLQLMGSRGFSYWSTGKIDPNLVYYFNRERVTPKMLSFTLAHSNEPDSVPASLISGQPMSFAFMELFSAYTAQCGGDFDKLYVPFRCVGADVANKCKYVFDSGSLGDAIRVSMTFPIVFQPIRVNGRLMYDGGIYDNFPVDVMREHFAPSFMIGVTVNTPTTGPQTSMMDQIDNLVIQASDYTLPDEEGIKIHIDLSKYTLLDFDKGAEIYQIGYAKGLEMVDSIQRRVSGRIEPDTRALQRARYRATLPHIRFDEVNVYGGTDRQNDYVAYLFRPENGSDTLGIERARDAFYRALSTHKLRDLYPTATYKDSTDMFALNLKVATKDNLKGSVGGYLSSATSSYLYLSVGYSTLGLSNTDASLSAWIGQTTMAGVLSGRTNLHTSFPSAVGIEGVVSRDKYYESDHAFYSDKLPSFILNHEYFGRAYWSFAVSRHSLMNIGLGYGAVRNSYYNDMFSAAMQHTRLYTHSTMGQVFARFESSTLDEVTFPTSGHGFEVSVAGMLGRNHTQSLSDMSSLVTHPKWVQGRMRWRAYPQFTKTFSLGIETEALLSTRKLLPTYAATIANAELYAPTPSANNSFRADFRANSYVAAGVVPIFRPSASMSIRVGGYAMMPVRRILERTDGTACYGKYFSHIEAYTEADISYHFPFGTLTGYLNYSTIDRSKWNVGLSFGIFVLPPKFLKP